MSTSKCASIDHHAFRASVVVLGSMIARFLLISTAPWLKLGLAKLSIYGKRFYEALSLQ